MKIEKIYVDMDGVLADFDRGVVEILGLPKDADDEIMWAAMREHPNFYFELKPIEGAVEFFKELREKYGDNCQILSAYPKPHREIHEAYNDKIRWIQKYFGEGVTVNLVYRAQKVDFCKNNNCVLVDDYEINIDEWGKAGGTGVLFDIVENAKKAIESL